MNIDDIKQIEIAVLKEAIIRLKILKKTYSDMDECVTIDDAINEIMCMIEETI